MCNDSFSLSNEVISSGFISNNFIETLNDVITHQKDDEDNNFNLLNNDNDNLNKDKNNKKNEQNEKNNKDNDNDTFVFQKVEQTESLFAACSIMDSVNISEELPNEIHNHALEKDALKDETCTMCLNKKTCENGYKCYLCPLIICDECSTKMRLYSISNKQGEKNTAHTFQYGLRMSGNTISILSPRGDGGGCL